VISALKTAAQQDKFGKSSVDPDSIKQTSQSPTASTSPTSKGGTQGKVCSKTKFKKNTKKKASEKRFADQVRSGTDNEHDVLEGKETTEFSFELFFHL